MFQAGSGHTWEICSNSICGRSAAIISTPEYANTKSSWSRPDNAMASTLTREQHLELYYFMRLNRELEEQMVRLFRQNKIVGGLYQSGARSDFGRHGLRARSGRLDRSDDSQHWRSARARFQAARRDDA